MPVSIEDFPKIISVDDHVVEPPHVWQDRLPAKYKNEGPRIVIAPQGEMLKTVIRNHKINRFSKNSMNRVTSPARHDHGKSSFS